jgi:hypothetical protein
MRCWMNLPPPDVIDIDMPMTPPWAAIVRR